MDRPSSGIPPETPNDDPSSRGASPLPEEGLLSEFDSPVKPNPAKSETLRPEARRPGEIRPLLPPMADEPADQHLSIDKRLPVNRNPTEQESAEQGAELEQTIDSCNSPPDFEIDDDDPDRTILFHRFDGKAEAPLGPHLELQSWPTSEERSSEDISASASASHPTGFDASRLDVAPDRIGSTVDNHSTEAHQDQTALESESGESKPHAESSVSHAADRHPNHAKRTDPIRHVSIMLVTVGIMFATARFLLPPIIEEIRYAQHRGQLRAEFEVAGEGLKNVSLDTLSRAYQMVNAAAGPSVVHIDIHRNAHEAISKTDVPGAPSILISDQGSGVVVDSDGFILTNRHVVASSDEISVTLSDGRKVQAVVIGTDELTDLAVLKVDADGLFPIPWGDSESIRVGSPVWAIGSPFGLDRTVTFGILSGKHRIVRAKDRYQDFMQSDVAVNPGNSGGPLVDSRGTLIGINTAIVGDTYQGVSFAIPSGIAKKIYQQLRESGVIERGWLGVQLAEVPNDQLPDGDHRVRGALITALADGRSGAAIAGLKPGDLVVRLDGYRVRDVDHLMQLIGNAMAGTHINLSIIRDDQEIDFDVMLGKRPIPVGR